MNIERGAKRAAYFFLGIIWVLVLLIAAVESGAYGVGRSMVYLLIFTLCYQLFGAAVAWVYRGFKSDQTK